MLINFTKISNLSLINLKNYEEFLYENKDLIIQKKKLYPFYSTQDVEFRLLRDNFLNKKEYKKIMLEMFKIKKFNYKKIITKIFLNKSKIKKLFDGGNTIGLHSHSHTFNFDNLPFSVKKTIIKKTVYLKVLLIQK